VPYIANRSEVAVAGFALLETLAQNHQNYDAIIGVGSPERGMNEELISSLNLSDDIASIRILEMSGSVLTEKQASADSEVVRLCNVRGIGTVTAQSL